MLLRHARLVAASALLLTTLATSAHAVTLWDQSNWNTNTEGSVNLGSNACSQISGNTRVHTTSDVHFDTDVHITAITVYETFGNVQAATQAYLWIAPKTGPMPTALSTDLYNAANLKPMTATTVTNGSVQAVAVKCSGLNISLPAGDYWISLTPRHNLGLFPYSVHLITSSAVVGDPTAAIEACTSNTNWYYPLAPNLYDYSIKVEGDLPVPTLSQSWGRLKMIYR